MVSYDSMRSSIRLMSDRLVFCLMYLKISCSSLWLFIRLSPQVFGAITCALQQLVDSCSFNAISILIHSVETLCQPLEVLFVAAQLVAHI